MIKKGTKHDFRHAALSVWGEPVEEVIQQSYRRAIPDTVHDESYLCQQPLLRIRKGRGTVN